MQKTVISAGNKDKYMATAREYVAYQKHKVGHTALNNEKATTIHNSISHMRTPAPRLY